MAVPKDTPHTPKLSGVLAIPEWEDQRGTHGSQQRQRAVWKPSFLKLLADYIIQ